MRLAILVILEIGCIYAFADHMLTIFTYLLGKPARGTILAIKRILANDKGRWFKPKNMVRLYEVSCDYLMDMEYETEDGETVFVENLAVSSRGVMDANGLNSKYGVEQVVKVKYLPGFKKRVVFDLPDTQLQPSAYVWALAWIFCILLFAYVILMLI